MDKDLDDLLGDDRDSALPRTPGNGGNVGPELAMDSTALATDVPEPVVDRPETISEKAARITKELDEASVPKTGKSQKRGPVRNLGSLPGVKYLRTLQHWELSPNLLSSIFVFPICIHSSILLLGYLCRTQHMYSQTTHVSASSESFSDGRGENRRRRLPKPRLPIPH